MKNINPTYDLSERNSGGRAKEFIVWSFGEKEIDGELIPDSRLDSRDRRRLRSQISTRDSALVRACLDPVELNPAFGLIAPLESCNTLEHSFGESQKYSERQIPR
ncbi:hypothetical protein AVEN_138925-1 [Araneus ventricosus]|uniref:Uncharacterized protein n=1 Tax=Araneus ventricosus TaxID=182803 RepID=A0A4Y2KBY1_ARAVE|nr:hypothetical protein AVEN_138925-1 [Araneus ventricosus]